MAKRRAEPLVWLLFTSGGLAAALLLPVLLVLFGLVFPAGWVSARCAQLRKESRGAHQRIDFPARDDERFLANSLIYRSADGASRVEYLPVRVTRWPPAERVYGR